MTALGLILSVSYVSGWTGFSLPTGWAVFSLILPWLMWQRVEMTPVHWLGLAFLAYAIASSWWAPKPEDAIYELWHLAIIAMAFVLGQRCESLHGFWLGMGLGCTISAAVAIAQAHGFVAIPTNHYPTPAGLFYNAAVSGAVGAVVLVGLLTNRLYWLIGGPLILIFLSGSRGAYVALAGTWALAFLAALSGRGRLIALGFLVLIGAAAALLFHGPSDIIRETIWATLIKHMSILGDGVGSLQSLYVLTPDGISHIEHAHNDYIGLAYEFGLGCLPLALAAALVFDRRAPEFAVLCCFATLGLYYWVLYSPYTAIALGLVAGNAVRALYGAGSRSADRRSTFLQWTSHPQRLADGPGRQAIPI